MLIPPPLIPWCEKNYQMADWTVVINNERAFHVNSIALASNSRYFYEAFVAQRSRSESKQSQLSRVTRIKYPNLDAVQYMFDYIARVSSTNEPLSNAELIDLLSIDKLRFRLQAARHFSVPRLIDGIVSSALQNLTHSTCWEVMAVAASPTCACDLLESVAKEYALCHFCDAAKEPQFERCINADQLCNLLQSQYLNAPHEFKLFKIICRWVKAKKQTRLAFFPLLLWQIRQDRLSSAEKEQISNHSLVFKTGIIKSAYRFLNLTDNSPGNLIAERLVKEDNHLSRTNAPQKLPRLPHQAIFLCGGWEANLNRTDASLSLAVQIFDPFFHTWTRHEAYSPAMGTKRVNVACVELDNVVYVIGGCERRTASVEYSQIVTDRVQAYYLHKNVWRERASLLLPRNLVCACKCDGRIYALGGDTIELFRMTSAERYCPEENRWVMIPPMRRPRVLASATSMNSLVYVCGGVGIVGFHDTMEQYNPATNQWTLLGGLLVGRAGFSLCAFCGFIYAIGGYNSTGTLNSVNRYEPISNTWSATTSLNGPRTNFGACVLYDHIYVFGGRTIHFHRSLPIADVTAVERYKLNGNWEHVSTLSLPIDSFGSCAIFGSEVIEQLLNKQ